MSKAFDTVDRPKLIEDLRELLNDDELHLLHILIHDVTLQVRVGQDLGEEFMTEKGIAQGDCLSAVLFIFYLAKSLNPIEEHNDHTYSRKPNNSCLKDLEDHNYYIRGREDYFEIEPKYADDITWASTAKHRTAYIKETIPNSWTGN